MICVPMTVGKKYQYQTKSWCIHGVINSHCEGSQFINARKEEKSAHRDKRDKMINDAT